MTDGHIKQEYSRVKPELWEEPATTDAQQEDIDRRNALHMSATSVRHEFQSLMNDVQDSPTLVLEALTAMTEWIVRKEEQAEQVLDLLEVALLDAAMYPKPEQRADRQERVWSVIGWILINLDDPWMSHLCRPWCSDKIDKKYAVPFAYLTHLTKYLPDGFVADDLYAEFREANVLPVRIVDAMQRKAAGDVSPVLFEEFEVDFDFFMTLPKDQMRGPPWHCYEDRAITKDDRLAAIRGEHVEDVAKEDAVTSLEIKETQALEQELRAAIAAETPAPLLLQVKEENVNDSSTQPPPTLLPVPGTVPRPKRKRDDAAPSSAAPDATPVKRRRNATADELRKKLSSFANTKDDAIEL